MSKILDVVAPPITSYTEIANLLSVLWLDQDRVLPWLTDHFVQLCAYRRSDRDIYIGNFLDDVCPYDICLYQICPLIECSKVDRDLFRLKQKNIESEIKALLHSGYYLSLIIDLYFISKSTYFMKRHVPHPVFIYGYSGDEVMISDFFGKYIRTSVKMTEILYGIHMNEGADSWTRNFYVFRINRNTYSLNIARLVQTLTDYLQCTNHITHPEFDDVYHDHEFLYGLKYYDALIANSNSDHISIVPFHVNYDHKVLMHSRISYLARKFAGGATSDNVLLGQYMTENELLVSEALALRNMVLKYNSTQKSSTLVTIKEKCMSLKEREYATYSRVLGWIQERPFRD